MEQSRHILMIDDLTPLILLLECLEQCWSPFILIMCWVRICQKKLFQKCRQVQVKQNYQPSCPIMHLAIGFGADVGGYIVESKTILNRIWTQKCHVKSRLINY